MQDQEKINQLLQSQTIVNNSLAFRLMHSQWKLSEKEAFLYLLDFHIQYTWTKQMTQWESQVDDIQIECVIYEDNDGYFVDNNVDLYGTIKQGEIKCTAHLYLGDFGYNIGLPPDQIGTSLLHHQEKIRALFNTLLDKFLSQ